MDTKESIAKLKEGNEKYLAAIKNWGDISPDIRKKTASEGQFPYAVIITCSDSRVPPEHIFSAGIGELFTIRTAGNVIGDYELGSVEYGAAHLGAKVIMVLGHSGCGAVAAALQGGAHGNIKHITDEICTCLNGETNVSAAEEINIRNSRDRIMASPDIKKLVDQGEVTVICAKYDISTGKVDFMDF